MLPTIHQRTHVDDSCYEHPAAVLVLLPSDSGSCSYCCIWWLCGGPRRWPLPLPLPLPLPNCGHGAHACARLSPPPPQPFVYLTQCLPPDQPMKKQNSLVENSQLTCLKHLSCFIVVIVIFEALRARSRSLSLSLSLTHWLT